VDVAFEAPSSELERRLAAIFTDVLGVARIGRWDDFFQLGGHSLLAAQVSARIRQKLNIGLELREFLDAPTIAALARHLEPRPLTLPRRALPSTGDREEIEL
jgi:acyl carrier protein